MSTTINRPAFILTDAQAATLEAVGEGMPFVTQGYQHNPEDVLFLYDIEDDDAVLYGILPDGSMSEERRPFVWDAGWTAYNEDGDEIEED